MLFENGFLAKNSDLVVPDLDALNERRKPKTRDDEAALTEAIVRLAKQYGRYGYRRVRQLLVDDGWRVSVKRVYRIWRAA